MIGLVLTLIAIGLFTVNRYYSSLLIFVGLLTQGFLLIPPELLLAGVPIEKTGDLALIYVLALCVLRFSTLQRVVRNEALFRWLLAFVLYVFADALYSRFVLGYELTDVVRVFRHNLIFLSFGVFVMVPVRELVRVWHALAVITLVQCVLYLLQLPTGLVLLGDPASTTVNHMEAIGWVRYYNTPTFLVPALFYYLFVYKHRSNVTQWFILGLLIAAVIAPMHRSFMLIVVTVASMYILSQQTTSKRFLYVALLIIVGNGVMMIDAVQSRINDGITDISKTLAPGSTIMNRDYNSDDTFSYRIAHLAERISYVTADPSRLLFGVGMLTEDAKQASKLSFEAGLFNQRTGQLNQIDTGDIAWSLLILYMGLVGVFFFIVLHVRLFRYFRQHTAVPMSIVGSLTLATVFLLSFTGTEILQSPFRASLMLLLGIVVKSVRASRVQPTYAYPSYESPLPVNSAYPFSDHLSALRSFPLSGNHSDRNSSPAPNGRSVAFPQQPRV